MQQVSQDAVNLLLYVQIGQIITALLAIGAALWAFYKWRRRDEHFPRMTFEVDVNFIGRKDDQIVCELVAILENKGVVPIELKDFTFLLRGLSKKDNLGFGGEKIRKQLNFHRELSRGTFIPKDWPATFVYPGVRTEYNFVTMIPADTEFVRMQGDFLYLEGKDKSHHAARILAVPEFDGVKEPPK
ncbi:hypothetical protein ACU8V1_23480 [Rhizobium leguminosarum]